MWIVSYLRRREYKRRFREWTEDSGSELEVGLAPPTVNGIKMYSRIEDAKVFGRPGKIDVSDSIVELDFYQKGLTLDYENEKLIYFGLIFSPKDDVSSDSKMTAARGTLFYRQRLFLSAKVTPENIIEILGKPVEEDLDDDEKILVFHIDGYRIETEYTLANALKRFNVYPI